MISTIGEEARARDALLGIHGALVPVEGAINEGDWQKAHALATMAEALNGPLGAEIATRAATPD
jgi:hypothetical protein